MRPRFIEVTSLRHDGGREYADIQNNTAALQADYFTPDGSVIINTAFVRTVRQLPLQDGSGTITVIAVIDLGTDERGADTVTVGPNDAKRIRELLLSDASGIEQSISSLTAAIRDLWMLLRNRLR